MGKTRDKTFFFVKNVFYKKLIYWQIQIYAIYLPLAVNRLGVEWVQSRINQLYKHLFSLCIAISFSESKPEKNDSWQIKSKGTLHLKKLMYSE